jgi:hypothetical protein
MFGAACRPRPPKWKLISAALLLRSDLKACVRYGCKDRFGNAMRLLRIIAVPSLGALLLQRPKFALSNRGGNNARQLEVVSHAVPFDFDRAKAFDNRVTMRSCFGAYEAELRKRKMVPADCVFFPRLADYLERWEPTNTGAVDRHHT